MGTLYRKFCPRCDGGSETNITFDGFAGAALTNAQSGGQIVGDGHVAFIADGGDLVPLPHPIESHALDAAGATWNDAAIHGRLLYIHNLVCIECGTQNTTATLHTGGTGCVAGLACAALAIACNVIWFNLHPLIEIAFVYIALFAPLFLIDRYVRIRYSQNAEPHKTASCIQCGGSELTSLASARKRPLTCPRCKQLTMTIEIAGRS